MSEKMAGPSSEGVGTASSRILVLEALVPIAIGQVTLQMAAFTDRLTEALFRLSDQSVLPQEASLSFHAWNHLKKNASQLQRGLLASLGHALLREVAALETVPAAMTGFLHSDLALVSLDDMEGRVLIGNIAQTIELDNSAALVALNLRLGRLLQREQVSIAHNPFRPAVFLRAVHEAWCKFDADGQSHRLVLRLLRPEVFFEFGPILAALNGALVARGIVPDLAEALRSSRPVRAAAVAPAAEVERRDASLHNKLQRWLQSVEGEAGSSVGTASRVPSAVPSKSPPSAGASDALLGYLSKIQRAALAASAAQETAAFARTTASLRQVSRDAPEGLLTALDRNTIELLARIFDFVFSDPAMPEPLKGLLARLQVPLLKTALRDQEFFFSEHYPARRLLEQLAQSGRTLGADSAGNDPYYRLIEQIVDRVQHEFDEQIGLYSNVVADLDAFLQEQQQAEGDVLQSRIADALRQEKMQQAQEAAEQDVASRIDSGEVAGFVEVFLETQWVRILTLAHSVAARKPEALDKARTAMDDLIWSVQPKPSPEERGELVSKLPALLSLINAWLNAVKWDDPARVTFFSSLVERHAAIVRVPAELLPRRQIEMAVNVAQKASERRLSKRARALQEQPVDQFVHLVDSIETGSWVEFVRSNGERIAYRLAWISPLRSRFIFSRRPSETPLLMSAAELAAALRSQGALLMPHESVITRALAAALKED